MWSALGPVPPACLLFMDAYYQAWSQQPGLCPGDWLQDMERLSEELLLPLLSQPALGSLWDSLRCCSPLCNPQSCAPAPEALPSLVSLGCTGGPPHLSLAGSASPFPFLTALLSLFNTLGRIHKGLCGQLAAILAAPGVQNYFLQCMAPEVAPQLTPFTAWALRHEYHLQYLALSLAQRAVGTPKPPYLCPLPHPPLSLSSFSGICAASAGHAVPSFLQTRPGFVPISIYSFPHFSLLYPLSPALCISSPPPPPFLSTGNTPASVGP